MILLFYCTFTAISQTGITVKEFKELPNDMDARVVRPVYDQNGKTCALVKVVTTEGDFFFDNGLLGITEVVHKPELSEWWVYMPAKTMKLKITHPVYGQLNDTEDGYYYFPNPLKEGTCYRMELTTLRKTVIYEQERVKTGYLIINTIPEGAQVYLTDNGEENYIGDSPIQKKLAYGTYNYRIKKSMYHDEVGVTTIDKDRLIQQVDLRPAFGSLRLTGTPEGAKVSLENDSRTFTLPCQIDKLPSGEHYLSIVASRYAPKRQKVIIRDGEETSVDIALDPRFARVSINTLPGASISINGRAVGIGNYAEELEEGFYDIEVTLAGHRPATRQIEVISKQAQNLTINPTPIYGSLDIVTTPMFADITLNGKNYGTTPATIDNLLIGDYEVVLSKQGCASVRRQVTITESNQSSIEATLPQGCEVSIIGGAAGDKVYIDNGYVGVIPYRGTLGYGKHTIELRQGDKRQTREINLLTTDTYREIALSWGLSAHWSSKVTSKQRSELQKLLDDMVYVEGGTFLMGAQKSSSSSANYDSGAYSDESPVHSVTLSSYYIGKYEVTQALWEAVMGENPSYFEDTNLPVENVSWEDCQKFIKKLNALTGITFRLPTEAEWEYAARGGNKSKGYKYSGSNTIGDVAWYYDNSSSKTHQVGTKQANELGIYDMSGNVWEWCSDWYGSNYYSSSSQTNPTGPTSGSNRVLRGGSWIINARSCRVSYRDGDTPSNRYNFYGFRLLYQQ